MAQQHGRAVTSDLQSVAHVAIERLGLFLELCGDLIRTPVYPVERRAFKSYSRSARLTAEGWHLETPLPPFQLGTAQGLLASVVKPADPLSEWHV